MASCWKTSIEIDESNNVSICNHLDDGRKCEIYSNGHIDEVILPKRFPALWIGAIIAAFMIGLATPSPAGVERLLSPYVCYKWSDGTIQCICKEGVECHAT